STINWPDTIQDRPGAAFIEGIQAVEARQHTVAPRRLVMASEPVAEEAPQQDLNTAEQVVGDERSEGRRDGDVPVQVGREPGKRRLWLWLLLGLLALLVAAGIAIWLWVLPMQDAERTNEETAPIAEEEQPPQEPEDS